MKRVLIAICMIMLLNAMALGQGDGPRGGGRGSEMMKQRLKEELKFSDLKVDSVTAIQQEFMGKNRTLRMDGSLTDDQKKSRMDILDLERKARLKTLLSEDELQKLEVYLENMRKQRQQRPA